MIAIAVVGGVVVLVLATIVFCCCRSRWRNRASAIEAATLAKSQPKVEPMTPTGPAPFAVNYPQFQVRMPLMAPPPCIIIHPTSWTLSLPLPPPGHATA